jgi:hypothetical protein
MPPIQRSPTPGGRGISCQRLPSWRQSPAGPTSQSRPCRSRPAAVICAPGAAGVAGVARQAPDRGCHRRERGHRHAAARVRRQGEIAGCPRHRRRDERRAPETVQAGLGRDPQTAFGVLEDHHPEVARQPFRRGEALVLAGQRHAVAFQRPGQPPAAQARRTEHGPQVAVPVDHRRRSPARRQTRIPRDRQARQRRHLAHLAGEDQPGLAAQHLQAGRLLAVAHGPETRLPLRQAEQAIVVAEPDGAAPVHHEAVDRAPLQAPRRADALPALALEAEEVRGSARPDRTVGILGDEPDARARDRLGRRHPPHLLAADAHQAAREEGRPQVAVGRRQHLRDGTGWERMRPRRQEALEAHAVESRQAVRSAHPEQTVGRLGHAPGFRRHAVRRRPGAVVELVQGQRAVQRQDRSRGRQQRRDQQCRADRSAERQGQHTGQAHGAGTLSEAAPGTGDPRG